MNVNWMLLSQDGVQCAGLVRGERKSSLSRNQLLKNLVPFG
jgi:hypothetical protein